MKTMCNCVELDCRRYGCKRTRGPIETEPTGTAPAGIDFVVPPGTTITTTTYSAGITVLEAIEAAVETEQPLRAA